MAEQNHLGKICHSLQLRPHRVFVVGDRSWHSRGFSLRSRLYERRQQSFGESGEGLAAFW